jgi:hypothetical protein
MMSFAEECSKKGFIFYNVNKVLLKNIKMFGQEGEIYELNNVKDIDYE